MAADRNENGVMKSTTHFWPVSMFIGKLCSGHLLTRSSKLSFRPRLRDDAVPSIHAVKTESKEVKRSAYEKRENQRVTLFYVLVLIRSVS